MTPAAAEALLRLQEGEVRIDAAALGLEPARLFIREAAAILVEALRIGECVLAAFVAEVQAHRKALSPEALEVLERLREVQPPPPDPLGFAPLDPLIEIIQILAGINGALRPLVPVFRALTLTERLAKHAAAGGSLLPPLARRARALFQAAW